MDSISFIKSPISAELEDFKKHFDSCLSSSNLLLNSVIAHIRQKNGKMMRPILVLLAAKLYNEICPATLHAAVALELLHTASLVHDDVVDESTERRGQLSVNAVFNNKVAVLTGDYLLATALVEVGMTRNYGIIDIVSKLGQDLAEGELLQLSNVSNPEYSEDIYFDVIRKKTAVLFAACMKAGALSVGAGDEKAEYARLFGEYIGLCFQIKDDIFDYYESEEIGKPTGNDMLEGKLTLPALYALNSTRDKQAQEIAAKVKSGTATTDEIARLIEFSKANGGIEYATKVMIEFKEKALSLLASMEDTDVKKALVCYLDYVVERENKFVFYTIKTEYLSKFLLYPVIQKRSEEPCFLNIESRFFALFYITDISTVFLLKELHFFAFDFRQQEICQTAGS